MSSFFLLNTEILHSQMKLSMGSTASSGALQEEPELAVLEDAVILAQVEYPCRRAGDLDGFGAENHGNRPDIWRVHLNSICFGLIWKDWRIWGPGDVPF